MKAIRLTFPAILVILTLLWLLADSLLPDPFTYFSFRHVFVQYSGVIAIGVMSIAILLALRPRWPELRLNGLDKMYRLHKWLGISALVASVLHWWFAKGTKWMVGWGWLEKPARGPRGEETLGFIESLFRDQRGFAESVGEWTFYAAAVLMIMALVKYVPYRLFAKTHKLLAVAYLLLAYHALILLEFSYWTQPVGWVTALLLLSGTVAAVLILAGRTGQDRRVAGTIDSLTWYPELRVMETTIRLQPGWSGHQAGQFAFVTSDQREGAHPYTIASAWQPQDGRITFITKALGDHTSRLRDKLKQGMPVSVEGPYGCFTFDDQCRQQIWVGAGIGITPFIARMKQLASAPQPHTVHLFHPTGEYEQAAIDKLSADAQAAGVTLHVLPSKDGRRLDGDLIRAEVPDWQEASLWFCGPAGFGTSLRKDFIAHGLPAERFHQELFQMR